MPGNPWDDPLWGNVEHDDFESYAISYEVRFLIPLLRERPEKYQAGSGFSKFLGPPLVQLRFAMWDDVQSAIISGNGPELSDKWQSSKGVEAKFAFAAKLPDPTSHDPPKAAHMLPLQTVARCFARRSKVIQENLLIEPGDWWIRMTMTQVLIRMGVPYLV